MKLWVGSVEEVWSSSCGKGGIGFVYLLGTTNNLRLSDGQASLLVVERKL